MKAPAATIGLLENHQFHVSLFSIYSLFQKGIVGRLYDVKLQIRFHY